MTLSKRVEAMTFSGAYSPGDVRLIEMQVSRAEEKLLRVEQAASSWTRPELRLIGEEEAPGLSLIQREAEERLRRDLDALVEASLGQ